MNVNFGRYDADEAELRATVAAVEEHNLSAVWRDALDNSKPGLLVIDMQHDFITGIERTVLYVSAEQNIILLHVYAA